MDECPRYECTVIREHRLIEQRTNPFFPVPPCALVPCQLAWHDEQVLDLLVEAGKQLRQPRVGVALEFVLVVADKFRHTVYEIPFQVQQLVVDRHVVARRTADRQLDARLAFAELACHALLVFEHRFDAQLRMVFDLRGEFPQPAGQIAEQFELGEVVSRHHVCFCLRREQPRQPTISADERLLEKIHDAVVAGTLDPTQDSVRKLLRCRQPKAGRLNRPYQERFGGVQNRRAA